MGERNKVKGEECKECPLFLEVRVSDKINKRNKVLIVGQSPHKLEVMRDEPFVGESGEVLNFVLDYINISRDDVNITNSLRCFEGGKLTEREKNKAIACCKPILTRLIESTKPEFIICLGAYAATSVFKKQKMSSIIGIVQQSKFGIPGIVTYHPSYLLRIGNDPRVNRNVGSAKQFIDDLKRAFDFVKNNKSIDIDTSGYKLGSIDFLRNLINSNKPVVAIDFETSGLDIFSAALAIRSISFSIKEGESHVYLYKEDSEEWELIKNILGDRNITKIVASRPFEEVIARKHLGVRIAGNVIDVLLMDHTYDENNDSYSLQAVANRRTPLSNIKKLSEGFRENLFNAPDDVVVRYNGVDTDATLRIFNNLKNKIENKSYYNYFLQPVQNMFSDIVFNGCLVDVKKLATNEIKLEKILKEINEDLKSTMPESLAKDFSVSKPRALSRYLFTEEGLNLKPDSNFMTATGLWSTSKEHLKTFSNNENVQKILEWKSISKLLTTYITPLYSSLFKWNKKYKVYPFLSLIMTKTGRSVMLNPPIQIYPVRSKYANYIRECFVADKNNVFIKRDLSQSEIRIMGWLSGDRNILKAINEGIDIHTKTASIINNVSVKDVTKEMRQKAKGINFGLLYGMSAEGLVDYLRDEYSIIITLEEAKRFRHLFFSKPKGYYGLPEYYEEIERKVCYEGKLVSPLGRIRRLPEALTDNSQLRNKAIRQAINFPAQSFSSDLGLIGMYLFWESVKDKQEVKPMWFIHDAVIIQCPEKLANEMSELLRICMEEKSKEYIKGKFNLKVGYPIKTDVKIGYNWSEI